MSEYKSFSENETFNIGKKIGKSLKKGDIVCLNGDLGVGKTVFVKGIAKSLGIDGYITSPTFTIVNEYESSLVPLYHLDVYRISEPDELYEIGIEEYIQNGIVVVEWAENVSEVLCGNLVFVDIKKTFKNENERIIKINKE